MLTGKQILSKYKKIQVLRAHLSKFPDKLDFEFCKKNTDAQLILVDGPTDQSPTKTQALMLASKICNTLVL